MKKKIKDLTLGEINKLCHSLGCDKCPLRYLDSDCPIIIDTELEREVEIDE